MKENSNLDKYMPGQPPAFVYVNQAAC